MYRHLSFHVIIVLLMVNVVTVLSKEIYDQIIEQNDLIEKDDPGPDNPDIVRAIANMGDLKNIKMDKKVQKDFPELAKLNFLELDEFEIDKVLRTIFSEVSPEHKKKVKDEVRKQRAFILNRKKMQDQHSQKLKEIYNFINNNNYKATLFILYEIRRIIKTRTIKDSKRLMMEQLSNPNYKDVKKGVLGCYKKFMSSITIPLNPFSHHSTNILVDHHIKDPYNDYIQDT